MHDLPSGCGRRLLALAVGFLGIAEGGCVQNEGNPPPVGVVNFPIATVSRTLDVMEGPRFLYVANSNFDLTYNAATLQSYDLRVVNQALADLCSPIFPPPGCEGPVPFSCQQDPEGAECMAETEPAHDTCALVPNGTGQVALPANRTIRICALDSLDPSAPGGELLVDEVRIGSFADGMELSPDERRLYLPVRSDADLTRIDLDDAGRFDCGGGFGTSIECTSAYRRSDRSVAQLRGESLPPDPVDIHVGSMADFPGHDAGEGNYVVMVHRNGLASLFLDDGVDPSASFVDLLSGLPPNLQTITRDPGDGSLWVPSADSLGISRLGVAIDQSLAADQLAFSYLYRAGDLAVRDLPNASAADFREVAFDPRPGVDRVYVVSRVPSALMIADVEPEIDDFLNRGLVPRAVIDVGAGPSRIALAELNTTSGAHLFAFVSCFDSRDIYVIDVDLEELVGVVRDMSGPFELEIDTVRNRIYTIDFRTSVIRIVDLEPLLDCVGGAVTPSTQECAPELLGLVGVPNAVEELR